jgi:hypothetical protein
MVPLNEPATVSGIQRCFTIEHKKALGVREQLFTTFDSAQGTDQAGTDTHTHTPRVCSSEMRHNPSSAACC